MTRRTMAVVLATLLVAGVGCKKSSVSSGEPGATASYTTIDWNTAGTVSGTVKLGHKAPPRIEIDMGQDPACALSGGANMTEQIVGDGGGLGNVFVYVKDGLGNRLYAAPSTPVNLDQRGCRYVPHVIGVMVGQPVEFTNSDPTMHNIHTPEDGPNPPVDISQPPKGGTTRQVFAKPQLMLPVRCNNHPWMQAYINVAANPFFAVSAQDGHFEIRGLPPGTYTLVAVHEQLGQVTTQITVASKQTATADFDFGNAGRRTGETPQ